MPEYIVTISDEEDKVLKAHLGTAVQAWVQHALSEKARKCVNRVISEITAFNPKRISDIEKSDILKKVKLKKLTKKLMEMPLKDRITYTP